jgi:hypothetical protein
MFASAGELSSIVFNADSGTGDTWRWISLGDTNAAWAPLLEPQVHSFVFSNLTADVRLDELILSTDPAWRPGLDGIAPVLTAVSSVEGVELAWTDSVTNEEGFVIDVSTNGSDFVTLVTVPAGTTSYVHSVAEGSYFYRIHAFNESDRTSFSNVASAGAPETPAVPVAPQMVSVSVKGRLKVRLEWQDRSADETGFIIERSTDNIVFEPILTVPANTVLARDSLDAVGDYYYRVRAFNDVGSSPPSDAANLTVTTAPKNLLLEPVSKLLGLK